ncbi:type II toxin-antitoxin system HipA family toxin [Nocardia xishanensis]|uniref:type II toxin-antitoxin system HipA family toxin n=1 Tax=Nocardia xishanensis TaxID=238964 RepID=UPI00082C4815|nr:HipA domain-containing protein [Nocardia xishanensis]
MTGPADFRRVTRADVYKAGRLAATLVRTPNGGTEFRYRTDYLVAHGEPVATTLPVQLDPVFHASGAIPPFFAGLLPEGHRLTLLRRAAKTSADDELTLLLAVGADVPGDVQIVPDGQIPVDPPALLEDDEPGLVDFARLVDDVDPHAIPGVQRKASASMISLPFSSRNGRFILKLSQPEYPHLIENEAAHLHAARAMKLPVAEASLVADRVGEPGLLVRRFDRIRDDGSWVRLAFEDGTQVLGLPPAAKYQPDTAEVVAALASLTDAPLVAIRNLYMQFLFAWLTGNGDLHAKNVGVLKDRRGRWSIAPIYDIPCTLLYDDDSMALPIAGRTRKLRGRDWAAFAAEIELPERAAASAAEIALRAAAGVEYSALPFSGSPLRRTERELRLRRAEIEKR